MNYVQMHDNTSTAKKETSQSLSFDENVWLEHIDNLLRFPILDRRKKGKRKLLSIYLSSFEWWNKALILKFPKISRISTDYVKHLYFSFLQKILQKWKHLESTHDFLKEKVSFLYFSSINDIFYVSFKRFNIKCVLIFMIISLSVCFSSSLYIWWAKKNSAKSKDNSQKWQNFSVANENDIFTFLFYLGITILP